MTPTSTVARKKTALDELISNGLSGPWVKLKPVYIETILGQEDDTGKDIFFVRVNKLPPRETFPRSYLGIEIAYLELPLAN